jgi:hypothetical protein
MYSHRRKASLLNIYKNHSLFRGEHFIDLNQTKGSNAHQLLLELVESNPKTADLGSDQKLMEKAILTGEIADIRDEFPLDWFQHISKIASDFHASKPFYLYFDFPIIREVLDNWFSDAPPFDQDDEFIHYKLSLAIQQSPIFMQQKNVLSRKDLEKLVAKIAEGYWKKHDYTVFFPAEIRLALVAYYLQF